MTTTYEIRPIGYVESPLRDSETAPKQGFEGAPDAWLAFNFEVAEGIGDITIGADVFVLTWLHRARRDVLAVHPRDDPRNPNEVFEHKVPGQTESNRVAPCPRRGGRRLRMSRLGTGSRSPRRNTNIGREAGA